MIEQLEIARGDQNERNRGVEGQIRELKSELR
jgi:hypothetical protein